MSKNGQAITRITKGTPCWNSGGACRSGKTGMTCGRAKFFFPKPTWAPLLQWGGWLQLLVAVFGVRRALACGQGQFVGVRPTFFFFFWFLPHSLRCFVVVDRPVWKQSRACCSCCHVGLPPHPIAPVGSFWQRHARCRPTRRRASAPRRSVMISFTGTTQTPG